MRPEWAVEFTPDAKVKRAAHISAGHDVGPPTEQQHGRTRYLLAYCECGFEFITHPPLALATPTERTDA